MSVEETFIGRQGDDFQKKVKKKAIEMGFLSEEQAQEQFKEYHSSSQPVNFGSFLLERGMLSVDQLSDLQEDGADSATMATTGFDDPFGTDPFGADPATILGADADLGAPFDDMATGAPTGQAPVATQDKNISLGTQAPTARLTKAPDSPIGLEYSGCLVEKKLGAGGMGSVWLAKRIKDDKVVVVKFLAKEQAQNPTWRARFLREAEMMRQIQHPNIVELYAVDGATDEPHIVMEYVEGEPLDEALKLRERFSIEEGTRIIRDLSSALAKAHVNGVIHRDIKPANALLTTQGVVKLLDFGLAKNTEVDDGLSLAGQILGTPHYMAPEQWGDHEVDARCDIFALGVTLYQLITGVLPFPGRQARQIARKIMEGNYVRPRDLLPDIPEDLELVIFRMMEGQRRFRYDSCQAAADDLTRVLEGGYVTVPRLIEKTGKRRDKRYPLLPGDKFSVGREPHLAVAIPDTSVSRQHAEIKRGKLGYTLRDMGSSYGTFVGNMRIREVVLKNGDEIKFGKTVFTFHDGGFSQALTRRRFTRKLEKQDEDGVRQIENVFLEALLGISDKRVVQQQIEKLAPSYQQQVVDQAWQTVRNTLGGEAASKITSKLEARIRRELLKLPPQLFAITKENLGDDAEAWLNWWDTSRDRYPTQISSSDLKPSASLRIVRGEPQQRIVDLTGDQNEFTIGRENGRDIVVNHRSVSRHHATLVKLHTRWALRDEGSRFGTLVNGQQVRVIFLSPGDQITLGKARLIFEEDKIDSFAGFEEGMVFPVDPNIYFCLEELAHPSVTLASIRFLKHQDLHEWIANTRDQLFTTNQSKGKAFFDKVKRLFDRQATTAKKTLSKVLGESPGDDPEAWRAMFREREPEFPPQVMPKGWFPGEFDSEEPSS